MRIGIAFPAASDRDRDIADLDRLLYHLACVLEAIGFVEAVLAVDTGGNEADEASLFAHRGATIRLADADAAIDVLIVTPGVIAAEWLACFRARGGRVVLVDPGSSHARLIETTLFDVPVAFSGAEPCDTVWLCGEARSSAPIVRAFYRCPVIPLPDIWCEAPAGGGAAGRATYRRDSVTRDGARPLILHHRSTAATMLVPLLICEQAVRADGKTIDRVHLLHAHALREQATFAHLIASSELYRQHRITIEDGHRAPVLGADANMVVAHQMGGVGHACYLDIVAAGFPLVHNLPALADVGYFYPDNAVDTGAATLLAASRDHDRTLDDYRARTARAIARVAPRHLVVQTAYARALVATTAPARAAA